MMDPIALAKQENARLLLAGLQARVERQQAEDEAEYPTKWLSYADGRHIVQRLGGNPIAVATSLSSGGIAPDQVIDAAYSPGLVAIDVMPYQPPTGTTQKKVAKPDIKILISKQGKTPAAVPLSPTTGYWTFDLYLKINQRPLISLDTLISQFQTYEPPNIDPSGFLVKNAIAVNPSLLIVQVQEAWLFAIDLILHYFVALHTYLISGTTIAHYELSPTLEFIEASTDPQPISYSSDLTAYLPYLIPSYNQEALPPDPDTPPNQATIFPTSFFRRFEYSYQGQHYWLQIKNNAGQLQNGVEGSTLWRSYLSDRRYQIGATGTPSTPRQDNRFPGYQSLKITPVDLALMGVDYTTPIYDNYTDSSALIGTIGDFRNPSFSTADDFIFFGNDGEIKTTINLEAIRGIRR